MNAIAKAYARRIKRQDITLADVPEQIRGLVASLLQEE